MLEFANAGPPSYGGGCHGCVGRGKQGNRGILIRYFVLLRGREMVMGSRSFALIVYFIY